MESNGNRHAKDERSKDRTITTTAATTTSAAAAGGNNASTSEAHQKSPRKRRKLASTVVDLANHFEQERPCTRCIKRNIGHLCHDEPRDPDAKKVKGSHIATGHDESEILPGIHAPGCPAQGTKQAFGAGGALGQAQHLQLVSPNQVSGMQAGVSNTNVHQLPVFSDAWLAAHNQFHDMHSYNPRYMLAPEVHNEFNLLNDFLNTSLVDDGVNLSDNQNLLFRNDQPGQSGMANFLGGSNSSTDDNKVHHAPPAGTTQPGSMPPPSAQLTGSIPQPGNVKPADPAAKTREFYLQAADPSGNDTPEERMQRVLKAKYDAGMLKPFNYVKGYARLGTYMDGHIASASKQKILRQLDRFRPKFREKMQELTDMELVLVEMWFETTLMEYDRVFAAMAIPACCWRRTGEIVRGNKEMAELIHVPVEKLRDGKISLHEILTEESLELQKKLSSISSQLDVRNLTHELENQICAIKAYSLRNPDSHRHQKLATVGTNLWNLCTQLMRQGQGESPTTAKFKLLTFARTFAFFVLALAQGSGANTLGDLVRLAKLAVKSSKSCIEAEKFELALLLLQKAADYNGAMQKLPEGLAEEELQECKRLEAEYLMLRMVLSWKEDRLDVSDHIYSKVEKLEHIMGIPLMEAFADALFEIGKSLAARNDISLATKWLDRAYDTINSRGLDQLSREAVELRMAISQALVHAHLNAGTDDSFQKAEDLVAYMESEIGDKLTVLLLRLELLLKSPAEVFDGPGFSAVLRRLIRNTDISETTFKIILHHVRILDSKSPTLACEILDYFFGTRVLPSHRKEWIEKVVVFRTQMTTSRRDTAESIQSFAMILDAIEENDSQPLGAEAAVSLQTLIWKKIESSFAQKQLDIAEAWCRTALKPALRRTVAASIHKDALNEPGKKLFAINELDWFCKNAYNIGLENTSSWHPRYLLRLFRCCLAIIAEYPKDIGAQASGDLALRGMFCNFMAAAACACLARSEDNVEVQLQSYLNMRKHVKDFDAGYENCLSTLDGAPRDDIRTKLSTLLVFDFEVLYSTLRIIVNQIWALEVFDHAKTAKYMRCLLQATLSGPPEMSLNVMEEICSAVKQEADAQVTFPPLELEWLITTAFNHGIDLYCSDESELSKNWIAHALTLAHYHQDGGDLEALLQERYTKLKWDA
ncbi:hypothetical protein DL765_001577 [Monosporascus sp. GIB2]|nr:hypothetical protein DL765_001577 [Monosporascus sp. GIB2]